LPSANAILVLSFVPSLLISALSGYSDKNGTMSSFYRSEIDRWDSAWINTEGASLFCRTSDAAWV
jgi:hypothetical protein